MSELGFQVGSLRMNDVPGIPNPHQRISQDAFELPGTVVPDDAGFPRGHAQIGACAAKQSIELFQGVWLIHWQTIAVLSGRWPTISEVTPKQGQSIRCY
ncbi:MAG: hypothetical protein R3F15_20640 [Lysobacterales bacterium]